MMVWQIISASLLHPVIFYVLEQLVIILILGFTSADSFIRWAFFPISFACICKITSILSESTHPTLGAAIRGGYLVGSLFVYAESALISKWTFEARGPTLSAGSELLHATHANRKNRGGSAITTQTGDGSFWERCKFGFFAVNSSRNIGTPYMVKNTPPFSSENPNYIPSRAAFLFRKAIIIVVAYLVIDLANQGPQPREGKSVFFSAEAVPIFTGRRENLTFEKIVSRFFTVLVYWFCSYQAVEGLFGLTDFVTVALGIKDVSLYRPNFGPIGEAYSVRQFWGVFWHQHHRKYLTALADLIGYKTLRLPKGKLVTRYLHLSLVFLASGLLHAWVEFTQGYPARQSGQIPFFVTQVIGIMLEDIVQAVYRAARGAKRESPPTSIARAVGYVWLVVFLWWSTPIWFYPQQRLSRGDDDEILPFSLFASLLRKP